MAGSADGSCVCNKCTCRYIINSLPPPPCLCVCVCVTGPAEEQTQKRVKIGQLENERKITGREFSENSTAQFFRLRERARVCV